MSIITSYDELPNFKELFDVDFENGKLYWKKPKSNFLKDGQEAGYVRDRRGRGISPKPYQMIQVEGFTNYPRGKIIYYLKYGVWCPMIDHINGNSLDDRLCNLREVSASKNAWNVRFHRKNKNLPMGVCLDKAAQKKKYSVNVKLFGKTKKLGRFSTPEEAKQVYDDFYRKYYGNDLSVDYYLEVQQQTPQWDFLRKNRITGTTAYQLLHGKSVADILQSRNNEKPFHGNYYTERGNKLEPEARRIYSDVYQPVYEVGAIINSKYPKALYSPDGVVGLDGLIEIKAFQEKRHLDVYEYLDPHIIDQIQFGLFISERKWCDFICYNPEIEDVDEAFLVKRQFPIPSIQQKFTHFLKENP